MPTEPTFWVALFEDMTPSGKLILFALIVVTILGGRALNLLSKKLDQTKAQATLAAVRSEPTSNGFAKGVQEKLDVLVAGQAGTEKRLRRLETIAQEQHPEATGGAG